MHTCKAADRYNTDNIDRYPSHNNTNTFHKHLRSQSTMTSQRQNNKSLTVLDITHHIFMRSFHFIRCVSQANKAISGQTTPWNNRSS